MRYPIIRLKLSLLLLIPLLLGVSYFNSPASYTKGPEPAQSPKVGAQVCQNPSPFPNQGFDYPQQASVVGSWVAGRKEDKIREHGWYLWAGLNRPVQGGGPLWRSWCTSTQAFDAREQHGTAAEPQRANRHLSLNAMRAANGLPASAAKRLLSGAAKGVPAEEDPINFSTAPSYPVPEPVKKAYPKRCYNSQLDQLNDGPTFQSNGDIMVAGVIYNDAAYKSIRDQRLYLAKTLNSLLPRPGVSQPMPPMDASSIVLKPMMWPVQGTGYTALPLWDDLPPSADDGKYAGFEVQKLWPRAVAVTPQPQSGVARTSVTYLHGVYDVSGRLPLSPITYRDAQVVPVESFYYFKYPDLDGMDPCDRAVLDASAYWAYNRAFSKEDYLVVVAMHIMTKEQADWTFQSVWWHDKPDRMPYAANRPNIPASQAPGPWRHYLLTSTYGITQRPPNADKWPVAYNPYIELAANHPIATNCMNCHHRAAWPHQLSSYEAKGDGAPDALDVYSPDNPIFNGLLMLDSMWAISDRATWPGVLQNQAK